MRWEIREGMGGLSVPPEAVYRKVSDPRNTSIVPGLQNARLIEGEEGKVGSKYNCIFKLQGLTVGSAVIEITKASPPYNAAARIDKVNAVIPTVKVKGEGEWTISEEQEGSSVIISTNGEILGVSDIMLELAGINPRQIRSDVRQALQQLKHQTNNPMSCRPTPVTG